MNNLIRNFLIKWLPNSLKEKIGRIKREIHYQWLKQRSKNPCSKVYCPLCKQSFSLFIPLDTHSRNSLCPFCASHSRHRLLWLYFVEKSNLFKDRLKLLHVSPELCFYNKLRKLDNLDYVSGDKIEEGYSYPKDVQYLDLNHLKFEDNSFDSILCIHVLEHMMDDQKAMRELYRVLKPGGWAIIQVPLEKARKETFEDHTITDKKERERIFGQWDHVRVYGLDYKDRVENSGFKVIQESYFSNFTEDEIERYGLMDEDIYLCLK